MQAYQDRGRNDDHTSLLFSARTSPITDSDLFSNMRAHVGRQVLRKNRRNNLKMFSVVLLGSFLATQPGDEARRTCNILSLAERRHEIGKRFSQRIIKDKSNVLFYLLSAKRDVQLTTRPRCARQYPTIYARTKSFPVM